MTALSPRRAPALRTRHLAVGYGSRRARCAVLERVDVAACPGELVCLLGANGIGKSTLLRTLAGIQPALTGTVELAGMPIESIGRIELARRLGVVLTERAMPDSLSVRRLVELGRYPHSGWIGRLTARDQRAVAWALDAVGVRHLADRDVACLSDGERQRVLIARALAQEPHLLVLDEPTAFLDVPSRVELMGLLRRLARDSALAVIASTHELELALRTADVIWLILPGGEFLVGAPEDVVLAGGIARAFDGRCVRFDPEERSVRPPPGDRGRAGVSGVGLRAVMARAVLEREGFAVGGSADDEAARLLVEVDESGWRVCGTGRSSGPDFASLATFLRVRRTTA